MWFECKCGCHIKDVGDGHYYKARVIADKKWNAFWSDIDDAVEQSGASPKEKETACMDLRKSYWNTFRDIYQCPECGRLYLEFAGDLIAFKPEAEDISTTLFDDK
jgi:hypothetical protein